MKEKEREKMRQKKKRSGKKKIPMRESNPRPLNLQTLKCCSRITVHAHL